MKTVRRSNQRLEEKQLSELLTAVFTLCSMDRTLTTSALDRLIARARIASKKRVASLRPNRRVIVDLDVLGHVIYIWQRTPKYLDQDGKPIPIRARGPAPSIEALFKVVRRSAYFKLGLKHLLRLKRISRRAGGKFVPCSEVTIVDGLTPEMVNLLTETMNRLVSTVLQNTSQVDPKALKLVERVTTVPDLPLKQVRAFKVFAREQGGALINTMNEWLESRRGSRKARSIRTSNHVAAGLHVFAFVEKG